MCVTLPLIWMRSDPESCPVTWSSFKHLIPQFGTKISQESKKPYNPVFKDDQKNTQRRRFYYSSAVLQAYPYGDGLFTGL